MTVKMKRALNRLSVVLLVWGVLSLTLTLWSAAGQGEDQQRDIEAKEVLKGRRKGKNPTPNTRYYYEPKPRRTVDRESLVSRRNSRSTKTPQGVVAANTFPIAPLPKNKSYMTVGVTLWNVRTTTEAEKQDAKVAKERMAWDQQEHDVVVTRMSDESPVPNQNLLQMTIEYLPDRSGTGPGGSNLAAHLYVINREQFPDGSLKNARLIFPTLLTYRGDNRLLPGQTVTLPDPARPFRIRRDATAQLQAYETYTIIISPVPLDSQLPRAISRKAMELSPELIAKWEQVMGITEVRADLRDGVGHVRTQRELGASGDSGESRSTEDPAEDLTQDDLPPQTVFRKVAKPGAGMLVVVRVPFKDPLAKP
jgi:hypothetical protein